MGMIAKCCLLMYEMYNKKNKTEALGAWLEKAKEHQQKAIKKSQLENSDLVEELRKTYSE